MFSMYLDVKCVAWYLGVRRNLVEIKVQGCHSETRTPASKACSQMKQKNLTTRPMNFLGESQTDQKLLLKYTPTSSDDRRGVTEMLAVCEP
jgi:hypothetical protein